MPVTYHLLDVFTDKPFTGNPLAVFPNGEGLKPEQMQRIARELNLSETVFVLPAEAGGTRRVRIFTPLAELSFAGHPTIGTAYLLVTLGVTGDAGTIVLEEGVGPIPVEVLMEAGRPAFAWLAAELPQYTDAPPPALIASMLSLSSDLLHGDLRPAVVSCGNPFLLVPLRDRMAVAGASVDVARWRQDFAGTPAQNIYVFALDPELPGSHVRARAFGPALGIPEDLRPAARP